MVFFSMSQGFLFVLFSVVTLTSCDAVSQESPALLDRLALVEEHLLLQNDVIQQLRQQNDVRLSDIDHLNRRLMSKLSQQEDRLSEQKKTIRQQGRRLSQQEDRLSEQEQTLRLQASRLSQQEDRLSEQQKTINQQDSKLLQQDQIIAKLLANKSLESMPPPSDHNQARDSSVTLTYHDLIARSDDTGALGVVVNEMSAEIQTLKNTDIKHTSDIQALQASHASDIQALKNSQISDNQALTSLNQHEDQAIRDARSSSFVRWGSSHCPSNSSLIYSGVVGGSLFTHQGAAVNYLCLTLSPKFAADRSPSVYALLYGAEYDTLDSNHDRDPVCAVCRASFSTTIMIPGTNVCTSGWTPLYSGFLMAGHYDHPAGSEYVCVDDTQESSPGTAHDDNGVFFSFTKTRCGSLPCAPYVNDKVVTCVVCGQ